MRRFRMTPEQPRLRRGVETNPWGVALLSCSEPGGRSDRLVGDVEFGAEFAQRGDLAPAG